MSQVYDQEEWDKGYTDYNFFVAPPEDKMRQWLEKYIPTDKKSFFEVGCFPGRYSALFGEKGFELNGLDLTPAVMNQLPEWFKEKRYNVGEFIKSDFLKYNSNKQYDVVASFGFIEHFTDWPSVIQKHANMVKDGGTLIISTPNFKGIIQRLLHSGLDEVNYSKHVINSMNPREWKKILESEGFVIDFHGYFGEFNFWACHQSRSYLQRLFLYKVVEPSVPYLNKNITFNHSSFSTFCGIVAHKA